MGEEMDRKGITGKIAGKAIAEIGEQRIDRGVECLDVTIIPRMTARRGVRNRRVEG
jgi:hypothetical protein